MKLRVRPDAKKGHWLRGHLYGPGEELPGEFESLDPTIAYKLEAAPASKPGPKPVSTPAPAAADAPQASSPPEGSNGNGGEAADWYKALSKELGKEPTKDDLVEYALAEFDANLDPQLKKSEMVAVIDKLESDHPKD